MMKIEKSRSYNDLVEIVSNPDYIDNIDDSRSDFEELAIAAIKQKPSTIKKISSKCNCYFKICKIAIQEDATQIENVDYNFEYYDKLAELSITINPNVIIFINYKTPIYSKLCKNVLLKNSMLINSIEKKSMDYIKLWEFAATICKKVLIFVNNDDQDLFPLIKKIINKDPSAIYYVKSNLLCYKELSNIAFEKDKESVQYMDINNVNDEIVMEILKRYPNKIKLLDSAKDLSLYKKACAISLEIDGSLIRYIYISTFYDNLDEYFELIDIARGTCIDIDKYPNVLYAFIKQNRNLKEMYLTSSNIHGDNLIQLLNDIDEEYDILQKDYAIAIENEFEELKPGNNDDDFGSLKKQKTCQKTLKYNKK